MNKKMTAIFTTIALITFFGLVAMTVLVKPYDTPEYQMIGNSETAFLIELEGNASVKLETPKDYESTKVMQKRVRITHLWVQEGRLPNDGKYVAAVKLIRVDRAPVTREWTPDATSGTSSRDDAIWVESADSIGFAIGFNCTALIEETSAAKFLYRYPSQTKASSRLAKVMDSEIRNKVQSLAANFAARYNLDELRSKKNEMLKAIKEAVIPHFQSKGITISMIGMYGGFTYQNKNIQNAIDKVFEAQQEKNKEAALLEAMKTKEARLKSEGVAEANRDREIASGKADAIKIINQALKEANSNPIFIKMKLIEVENNRIKKWSGQVPRMIFNSGGGKNNTGFVPLLQIPTDMP